MRQFEMHPYFFHFSILNCFLIIQNNFSHIACIFKKNLTFAAVNIKKDADEFDKYKLVVALTVFQL